MILSITFMIFCYNFFDMKNFGEKLKELRIEKGLSQIHLAKIIGVSQKAIDYWERNVNEPKASYIISLVRTFDLTFDEFFQISSKTLQHELEGFLLKVIYGIIF